MVIFGPVVLINSHLLGMFNLVVGVLYYNYVMHAWSFPRV